MLWRNPCEVVAVDILGELRIAWPGRVILRAHEVALVLRGSQTPDVVKRVRERMRDGVYGEALKVDGVLQLPLVALAEYIRPRPEPPPIPRRLPGEPMKPRKRRRSQIGPYLR